MQFSLRGCGANANIAIVVNNHFHAKSGWRILRVKSNESFGTKGQVAIAPSGVNCFNTAGATPSRIDYQIANMDLNIIINRPVWFYGYPEVYLH